MDGGLEPAAGRCSRVVAPRGQRLIPPCGAPRCQGVMRSGGGAMSFGSVPDEVVSLILSLLPGRSRARSRLVCKAWNKMIADLPSHLDWCVVLRRDSQQQTCFRAFDPEASQWRELKLPPGRPQELDLIASRAGLVALRECSVESLQLETVYWVGNPLTGKWQRLGSPPGSVPPFPQLPEGEEYVGSELWHEFVVDEDTGTFKIVRFHSKCILNSSQCYVRYQWAVELYDSASQTWKRGATLAGFGLNAKGWSFSHPIATVACRSTVFLLHSTGVSPYDTYGLVGYDVEKDQFNLLVFPTTILWRDRFSADSKLWLVWDQQSKSKNIQFPSVVVALYDEEPESDYSTFISIVDFDPDLEVWKPREVQKLDARFLLDRNSGVRGCGGGLRHCYSAFKCSMTDSFLMYRAEETKWTEILCDTQDQQFVVEEFAGPFVQSYTPRLDIGP